MNLAGFTAEAALIPKSQSFLGRNNNSSFDGTVSQEIRPAQGIEDLNGCYDACAKLALESAPGDLVLAAYYYRICAKGCETVYLPRQVSQSF